MPTCVRKLLVSTVAHCDAMRWRAGFRFVCVNWVFPTCLLCSSGRAPLAPFLSILLRAILSVLGVGRGATLRSRSPAFTPLGVMAPPRREGLTSGGIRAVKGAPHQPRGPGCTLALV